MSQPWRPHLGQKKLVKFFLEHAAAAAFADPGVGKTSAVYAAFKILRKRKLAHKMLVIAPLKPCWLVWPAEQEKWTDFADLRVVVLHGPDKAEALAQDADVYVINPDGLDWLLGAIRSKTPSGKLQVTCDIRAFRKLGFDILVVDELTQFKHQSSGRFKALKQVVDTFGRRWGLTGTPVPNGLIDLFGQCYTLDQGRTFGQFVTHFRQKYFLPSYDGIGWVLRRGAEKEIYERLKPLAIRLDAKDYIDMPQLVENSLRFDLPPVAKKLYDQLEEDMFAELDGTIITAASAATASMKLRQLVNGGIYIDEDAKHPKKKVLRANGRPWSLVHNEKTDMLEDLINELQGSPLLVAYDFHHDLERLKTRFGKDIPNIGSGTSTKEALRLEAAWNRGELPYLFGHPQSMGHGLNLQRSSNHVAWYALTWNREYYDQLNGRVQRQGNSAPRVFVHHFIARGTIDDTIFYALRGKARVQNALLLALKEMQEKRK